MVAETNCCKVGRAAQKYGITSSLEKIGEDWTNPEGDGVRKLATQFNKSVIIGAFEAAGEDLLDGEAEVLYDLLTADGVDSEDYRKAQSRLREHGIEPENLVDDFVSYKTINRHFKSCTDRVRDEKEKRAQPEEALDRVNRLKKRLENVTESAIKDIKKARGVENPDDIDVLVSVSVAGEDGLQKPLREVMSEEVSESTYDRSKTDSPTGEESSKEEPSQNPKNKTDINR